MVIIQVIQSTWTKQSRGHPGSVARAAVPEAFRADAGLGDNAAVVIQTVRADEQEEFALQSSTEVQDELPAQVGSVLVTAGDKDEVRVTRRSETGRGWPTRDRDSKVIALQVGETCRLVRNFRHSGHHGWSYEKLVVNVANVPRFSEGVFSATEPSVILDEQGDLF